MLCGECTVPIVNQMFMNTGDQLTFSIFGQPSASVSCSRPLLNIFEFGSTLMATSRKPLSKNGTRASRPQAIVDLGGTIKTAAENHQMRSLVGPQAIGCMQVLDPLDAFLMERLGVWGSVEIEIT